MELAMPRHVTNGSAYESGVSYAARADSYVMQK
jgi:hypothetical protein